MALQLDRTAAAPRARTAPRSGRRVAAADRIFFTEQLALLLETGVPLLGALHGLAQQAPSPAMAAVIESLAAQIAEGRSFGRALAQHPAVFSRTYVALVEAGENGGFLERVLLQLQAAEEKRAELRRSVGSALAYPAFLMAFSVAVVVFVLVVVFPRFAPLFAEIQDQLPASTRVLLAASGLLTEQWPWVLMAAAGAVGGTWLALRSAGGRELLDAAKLRLPVVREVFVPLYLMEVLRVASLSLANGVALPDALAGVREVIGNRRFRGFLQGVESRVQEGAGIAAGFSEAEFVPDLVKQMIRTGESSGHLPRVMGRVAEHYEVALTRRLKAVSRLMEPVLLLVMGAVVGLIVSSLILPIFKLARLAG